MEELPKIKDSHITRQEEELRDMMAQGTIMPWLSEQLKSLAEENPLLYKHIMEHTQKFAMGVIMVQDPQAIAISMALEQLVLLTLLVNAYKDNKDLKRFTDFMNTVFPSGIKGLEDLGKDS